MNLSICEHICNLTIESEGIWGKKAVAQAKKCLNLIGELRLMKTKEHFQAVIHEMAILAQLQLRK